MPKHLKAKNRYEISYCKEQIINKFGNSPFKYVQPEKNLSSNIDVSVVKTVLISLQGWEKASPNHNLQLQQLLLKQRQRMLYTKQ